jgi:putative membrane protein
MMIKRLSWIFAALMVLGIGGAASAKSNAAGHHSNTGTNMQDRQFAENAAMGGTAEIDLSRLALRRSHNAAIDKFAAKMVHDHTIIGNNLVVTARPLGLPTPMALDAAHRAIRAKLARLSGKSFDNAYIAAMIEDHAKTVSLFQKEIAYGKNIHMTNFATKNLSTIQNHLSLARDLSGTEYRRSKIKNPPAK